MIFYNLLQIPIEDVDFTKVADGTYKGTFSYSKTTTTVEIAVKDHKIETLNILEHGTTDYAKKAVEGIEKNVLEAQSLKRPQQLGRATDRPANDRPCLSSSVAGDSPCPRLRCQEVESSSSPPFDACPFGWYNGRTESPENDNDWVGSGSFRGQVPAPFPTASTTPATRMQSEEDDDTHITEHGVVGRTGVVAFRGPVRAGARSSSHSSRR